MLQRFACSLFSAFIFFAVSSAQESAPRFHWKPNQTFDYKVDQTTTVTETADKRTETYFTRLSLQKRWTVLELDDQGGATLQLTLLALRLETRKPNGQTDIFDSQNVDKSSADLNKEMLQFIGSPIAVLRLDVLGRVTEVKKSRFGSASRFQAELPFRLALPGTAISSGQAWERTYKVKLEPPQGTGETYDAVQSYTCKAATPQRLEIRVGTMIKAMPDAPADRIPLVPFQPEGTIIFDVPHGRMLKADLKMDAEFNDHRGDGSKYRYSSVYSEEFVER